MPTRAPTDRELARARQQSNQRTNAERRAVRGPDPRSTARWRRLRAMVLSEQPICADPYGVHQAQGRVEVATEVDHIVGVHVDASLVFVRENCRALCHPCHARRSMEERRG
jgi:5-methylcytosine-specific restriction endonuclease McrA